MSERPPDLSLVVACYDEAEALPRLFGEVERLEAAAAGRGLAMETVLVDDGSRDGSGGLLARFAARGPSRRVETHPANRGFGAAMRTGFAAARGEAVVCYDADATYPVLDVLALHAALREADAAGASPFREGGRAEAAPLRRLLSRGAAAVYRAALRDRAGDLTVFTCAFRAYRREALRDLPLSAEGFLAAAECLCLLLLGGARVREVPSVLSARAHGRSKMRSARTALGHLLLAARVFLRAGRFRARPRGGRRPQAVRVPAPAGLAAWNRALNAAHPMERIERHPNPVVRCVQARRREEVMRLAAVARGHRVLDVGAERGAYRGRIRDCGGRPVALDVDAAVLDPAAGPAVAADAARLPFADGSFPRVLLPEVLEHCPDPEAAVAEALRVLAPGGRVALSVPDDALVVAGKRLLRRAGLARAVAGLPPDRAPGHLHGFGREGLVRLLAGRGRILSFARDPRALAFLAAVGRREGGR